MEALLIPVDGTPVTIDLKEDAGGSTLRELQRLVGGSIEPLNVLFGEEVSIYVNEEGNRPLTDGECQTVRDYFTRVSAPGSGLSEVLAITKGPKLRQGRAEGRNSLREEASEMRSSSSALAGGRKGQDPFEQDRQA